jgi:hypothetical protein
VRRTSFNGRMPQLTRRSYPGVPEECWLVYYGDTITTPSARNGGV